MGFLFVYLSFIIEYFFLFFLVLQVTKCINVSECMREKERYTYILRKRKTNVKVDGEKVANRKREMKD